MTLTLNSSLILAQSPYAIGQIVGAIFMVCLIGAIIWSVINKKK